MAVISLNVIQTTLVKIILKVSKYIKTLKLKSFSTSSLVHVTTILNFAPSPTKIPLDVHATMGYKQGSLLERPSGITSSAKGPTKIPLDTAIASCAKAISMGSVISSTAGSGKSTRSWRNC